MTKNLSTIADWKLHMENILPPVDKVIERNKAISATYASIYDENTPLFKWSGMAAFASYHIGLSLLPFKWVDFEMIDMQTAIKRKRKGFKNDIQLIRLLNNSIFEDIGWVHIAYDKVGIEGLEKVLANDKHYQPILTAFRKINQGAELIKDPTQKEKGEQLIWEANTKILWHEQSVVVQPVFDKLGDAFARAMSFCATFDYKISHTKTDWRTHSSFILYMLFNGFSLVRSTGFMPIVTNLTHRWHWIENSLLNIWKSTDRHDPNLCSKVKKLAKLMQEDM